MQSFSYTSNLLSKYNTEAFIAPIDIAKSTCKLNRDRIMTGKGTTKLFICMTKYTLNVGTICGMKLYYDLARFSFH